MLDAKKVDKSGMTLLMKYLKFAVRPSIEAIRRLLKACENLNLCSSDKNTAIKIASANAKCPQEVFSFLISRNADPNLHSEVGISIVGNLSERRLNLVLAQLVHSNLLNLKNLNYWENSKVNFALSVYPEPT